MAKKRKGERADGLIQISISLGHDENGKRVRKVFYGHTKAEAERKRDAFLMLRNPSEKCKRDMTVAEWVDIYLKTYRTNVNPLYIHQDDVAYNRLKNDLGLLEISKIREIDLQASLNKMVGKSFSSLTKYRQAIQRVFRKAVKNGIILRDPSDDLQMPTYTKGTHNALELQDVQLINTHWKEAGASGLWMMIMLYAGLRRGEMMALDWANVDMKERTITVKQVAVISHNQFIIEKRAKTQAGLRVLPIPAPLLAALETIPPEQRHGLVCLTPTGKPLSDTSVKRGLDRFCNVMTRIKYNLPSAPSRASSVASAPGRFSLRLHDLRHTYCTLLYASNVDVKTAAYLMGHADIKVTMEIYTHLSAEKKAKSTSDLLAYFDNISDIGSKLVVKPEQ